MKKNLGILFVMMILVQSCGSTIFNPAKEEAAEKISKIYTDAYAKVLTCAEKAPIKRDALVWIPEHIKFLQQKSMQKGFISDLCVKEVEKFTKKTIDKITLKAKPESKGTGEWIQGAGAYVAQRVCEKIKF